VTGAERGPGVPRQPTAETGAKALFFAYFSMTGAFSPYIALYFAAVGLSITQIGVLVALPQVIRLLAPPFWGAMADQLGRRLPLLRLSAAIGLASAVAIAFAGGHYAALLALLAVFYFAGSAQAPLAETIALALSGGESGRYGRIRMWGSIGFISAVAANGPLLDAVGIRTLPVTIAVMCVVLLAVTWRVAEPPARHAGDAAPLAQRLREPAIAAFFVSCLLMQFAHAALYGFYSLYLDGFGYTKTAIGGAWTVGVVCEIALFRLQRPLFERYGALALLSFSMAVAAARFALVAWGGGWWPAVFLTQLMHAVTFGVHHSAVMALLHRWFEPAQQARAQALYTTLGYGGGGALGGLAAGWAWANLGPAAAFYGAAAAAALGWAAVAVCRRFEYARASTIDAHRDGATHARPGALGDVVNPAAATDPAATDPRSPSP